MPQNNNTNTANSTTQNQQNNSGTAVVPCENQSPILVPPPKPQSRSIKEGVVPEKPKWGKY